MVPILPCGLLCSLILDSRSVLCSSHPIHAMIASVLAKMYSGHWGKEDDYLIGLLFGGLRPQPTPAAAIVGAGGYYDH